MVSNLRDQLKRDEGEVLHVYLDSLGIRTAGVGHNLEAAGINWPVDTPISQEVSDEWLDGDIVKAQQQLYTALPWALDLDEIRQAVLVNMSFNMGIHGLLQFHRTLTFIEDELMASPSDYSLAAAEMLKSRWAFQVKDRASRLAIQLKTGEWV